MRSGGTVPPNQPDSAALIYGKRNGVARNQSNKLKEVKMMSIQKGQTGLLFIVMAHSEMDTCIKVMEKIFEMSE